MSSRLIQLTEQFPSLYELAKEVIRLEQELADTKEDRWRYRLERKRYRDTAEELAIALDIKQHTVEVQDARIVQLERQLASLQADAAVLGTLEKLVQDGGHQQGISIYCIDGVFHVVKGDASSSLSAPTLREAIEATNQSGDNSGQMHNEGDTQC